MADLVTKNGVLRIDYEGWREIPFDPGLGDAMEGVGINVAVSASRIADETYTVSLVRGRFRQYVRVAGQEPGTGGFWRGKKRQALWSSTPPSYGGNR